jgi:hypothetical protein
MWNAFRNKVGNHPRAASPETALNRAQTKGTTGKTDSPKSLLAFALPCQLTADRLAAAAEVDPRFTLAVWTLALGPLAAWTLVPSDACHYRHWSLSALVTVGAGWCEKPLDQPKVPTLDETSGSCMKF